MNGTAPSDSSALSTGLGELKRPIRLGCVSYLNTRPLIEGLEKLAQVELLLSPPSRLIDRLEAGDVDLALISVIDLARSNRALAAIPVGMIGSSAQTMTVRVFSRVPIERIKTVHVDADSHTSVALMRIVLADRFGVKADVVEFSPRDADLSKVEAFLVIGDKVVTTEPGLDDFPHRLDLGQEWRELTNLPFVYAVWACAAEKTESKAVQLAAAVLDRQRRHNALRTGWIAAKRAPEHGWDVELAQKYLGERLSFELDEEFIAAIEVFFEKARAHGLIDQKREIRWMSV